VSREHRTLWGGRDSAPVAGFDTRGIRQIAADPVSPRNRWDSSDQPAVARILHVPSRNTRVCQLESNG
jgi:hypothetical protein